jgi:hypothetical protein
MGCLIILIIIVLLFCGPIGWVALGVLAILKLIGKI